MKNIKSIIIIGGSFAVVIFLIYLFFGGTSGGELLSINRFFLWFLGYIFCFIVGLCLRFYDDGGELDEDEAKKIKAWKAEKSRDSYTYNDKITLSDKLFFKWGHPLDVSRWDFEYGFVNWLLQTPFMGFVVLGVTGIAVSIVVIIISLFFGGLSNIF
jgi:hypothetical protein